MFRLHTIAVKLNTAYNITATQSWIYQQEPRWLKARADSITRPRKVLCYNGERCRLRIAKRSPNTSHNASPSDPTLPAPAYFKIGSRSSTLLPNYKEPHWILGTEISVSLKQAPRPPRPTLCYLLMASKIPADFTHTQSLLLCWLFKKILRSLGSPSLYGFCSDANFIFSFTALLYMR